jgi:hypothetical protein
MELIQIIAFSNFLFLIQPSASLLDSELRFEIVTPCGHLKMNILTSIVNGHGSSMGAGRCLRAKKKID